MAGGLFGTQAHAAVTIPNRVAAVRAEIDKRVSEAKDLWSNWQNWLNF